MKLMMTMAVIASVLAAQSCILEDRTGCPTYLTLDLSSTPEEVGLIHLILEHHIPGHCLQGRVPVRI